MASIAIAIRGAVGYNTVALNHNINGKPPAHVEKLASTRIELPADAKATLRARAQPFRMLSRLTVHLTDAKDAYHLNGNSAPVKQFDLVAYS